MNEPAVRVFLDTVSAAVGRAKADDSLTDMRFGPYQRPGYKGDDIYPPFACDDGMRAGGVNIGNTRQLVHDLIYSLMLGGWEGAVHDFGEQRCTDKDYARFLHDLLDLRGEFGRLLLHLAAAVRHEIEHRDAVLEEAAPGGGLIDITPGAPGAVKMPPPWWKDPKTAGPVVEQLRRCLAVLEPWVQQ